MTLHSREGGPREGGPREGRPREGRPREDAQPEDAQPEDAQPEENATQGRLALRSVGDAVKILIPIVCLALLATMYLRYNPTPSVPSGLYVRVPFSTPAVGEYAFACLEEEPASVAAERGYVPASWYQCSSGLQALLKRIVASGGDTVTVRRGRGLVVNGRRVGPLPSARDTEGRPVPLHEGQHVLKSGEYWLASTAYMGYDSRIFGPVPRRWLQGRAVPVWTRPVPISLAAPPGKKVAVWAAEEGTGADTRSVYRSGESPSPLPAPSHAPPPN
jgi:conjugative transfer signal peptidase TraF